MKGHCQTCGEVTLWTAKAVFDGFRKTGDRYVCSDCGTEQQAPAAPAPKSAAPGKKALPSIFDESDRPEEIRLADAGESRRTCRHCKNYLVNAFTQRCSLTLDEVKATDTCDRFDPKAPGGSA
ncbi:MAG: hypothetical protein U1F77_07580 [Kiritimatiellia bacterium]